MKSLLIPILMLSSLATYGQQCLQGEIVTDLTDEEIESICETKVQKYNEAKDRYDQVYSNIDMTNMQDIKLWTLVLGPEQNYLVKKAQNDMRYCSDCSQKAHIFYKCSVYEDINKAAEVNYKKEYLKLNLLDRADQLRWQQIEPDLNLKIKDSSKEFRHCKNS